METSVQLTIAIWGLVLVSIIRFTNDSLVERRNIKTNDRNLDIANIHIDNLKSELLKSQEKLTHAQIVADNERKFCHSLLTEEDSIVGTILVQGQNPKALKLSDLNKITTITPKKES